MPGSAARQRDTQRGVHPQGTPARDNVIEGTQLSAHTSHHEYNRHRHAMSSAHHCQGDCVLTVAWMTLGASSSRSSAQSRRSTQWRECANSTTLFHVLCKPLRRGAPRGAPARPRSAPTVLGSGVLPGPGKGSLRRRRAPARGEAGGMLRLGDSLGGRTRLPRGPWQLPVRI